MKKENKIRKRLLREQAELSRGSGQIKAAELKPGILRHGDDIYRLLVESTDDSIYLVDGKCRYIFMNKKHLSRLALPFEQVIGQPYGKFHSAVETRSFVEKVNEVCRTGKSIQHMHRSPRDGRYFLRTLSPCSGPRRKPQAVAVISKDISELKITEEKLLSLSNTDELTGLFNRRGFLALAGQQLKISHRLKKGMLLLSADMDDLKKINDTFGHREGDRALTEIACVLRESFRDGDIIARIGGDEFVVLLIGPVTGKWDVYVTRLQKKMALRNKKPGRGYMLSISIGLAYYDPRTSYSIDDLIAAADKIMYEQKRIKKEFQRLSSGMPLSHNLPAAAGLR